MISCSGAAPSRSYQSGRPQIEAAPNDV